jgi:diaminopimelate epimerase
MVLQFSKYQGIGNDFLLLDGRSLEDDDIDSCFGLIPESVRRICDRRFGVGADGVIVALPPRQGGELRMRIFNADGTEPEMCGNGIRCLARFSGRLRRRQSGTELEGRDPGRCDRAPAPADGRVQVDMGRPFLRSRGGAHHPSPRSQRSALRGGSTSWGRASRWPRPGWAIPTW